jgi:hypothetical protein
MIFYSVSVLNAASFVSKHLFFRGSRFILTHPKFGRILPGKLPHCNTFAISNYLFHTSGMLADTWGPYNIMIVTAIMCSVLTFASIAAKDTASILVVGGMCIGNRHRCGNSDNLICDHEKRSMGSRQAMCSAYRVLVYPHFWYALLITTCHQFQHNASR